MCVAVGDFNNDTCLNVVVANYDNNTVSVLLGYGNGSFRSQVTYSIGDKPLDITVGDFNNNTRPGVMIVNNEERTVSVLLRYDRVMKNEITFAPSVGAHWRSVAVFDFNKDDLVDVVVANDGANSIGVLLGYGNESYGASLYFAPVTVGLGELDNDGHSEIAVAYDNCDYIDILVQYHTGAFPQRMTYITDTWPESVAVGNFNNDHQLDIIVISTFCHTVDILLGNGNGTCTSQTSYSTRLLPISVTVGDFNNDNRLDIVVANYGDDTVSRFIQSDNGTYKSNIAIANHDDNTISVLLGYGDDSFTHQMAYSSGSIPITVVTGDFNSDTRLDLVITNGQKKLLTGSSPIAVAVDDFNSGNILDIVVANYDSGNVGGFLWCGSSSFLSQETFPTGSQSRPKTTAVGVFNNHTFIDIIVANYGMNNMGIVLGYGNGSFANVKLFSMRYESLPFFVSVDDFNGDRKLDFAVANEGSDSLEIFLQTG
ncbi:unnamed protein product [Rotaria magnacalcarata]|uniref:VCBS repeat-containing protein n=1 Tax=Rotaria magnacalcarata TaxID=392030 RepID=A0A8S2MHM5_9BILA|nr:unnamed protein product [Rotaria magnacalcarata]CAF3936949.1 unnamed protein product [Rotaria magnacalcarata]CAF3956316.1 unnamed protein product [Rotaria magnacalcarata]